MKEIALSRGKIARVDNKDFKWLNQYRWYFMDSHNNTNYAYRILSTIRGACKNMSMHREIMGCPVGMEIDHIDGNGLNNLRSNLRICTVSQNHMNQRKNPNKSSIYKGVAWDKRDRRWKVRIGLNGKSYYLGYFKVEKDAGLAYDEKAKELFGEFARLNFPDGLTWSEKKGVWVDA